MAFFDLVHLTRREKDDIVRRELERRRKVGEFHRGRKRTPEQCQRISEGHRRSWARRKATSTETAQV